MNSTLQDSASAQIKTGIWEDESFIDTHSIEDRFLLIYFLTCPGRHLSGVIKINFRVITSHTGWDKQQILIVLERLINLGSIVIVDSYLWIKQYYDHNQLPTDSHFKKIGTRLTEIPDDLLNLWIADAKERGVPVGKVIGNLFDHPHTTHPAPPLDPHTSPLSNNNNNSNKNGNSNSNHNCIGNGGDESYKNDLASKVLEALKSQVGVIDANDKNPDFIDLITLGLTVQDFLDATNSINDSSKRKFNYVLKVAKTRYEAKAKLSCRKNDGDWTPEINIGPDGKIS